MEAAKKLNVLNSYTEEVSKLPTLPHIVMKILQMINHPDVRVERVADLLLQDKVLTTQIIRMVNSAFWGVRKRVTSVREAIVLLGLKEIKNVVITTSLFNAFPFKNQSFRISSIWEHGLGCALISRIIAEMVAYPDLEEAYLAGLVHDIGEVILSQFQVERFQGVLDVVQEEKISFYEAEGRVIGIDHTDFGEWFSERWNFSDALSEVIRMHHTPERARLNPQLVAIVALADLFCRVRGLDYGYTESLLVSFREETAWRMLAENNPTLQQLDVEKFTLNLDGMVGEVVKTVKAVYGEEVA